MSTVDEVKQKLDIVEVIGQYVKLTKAGRNFKAVCPFHNEKTASFYVFPERQSWHCFGACSTGGDVFTFVMKKEGLDFGETLRLLADKVGVNLPSYIEQGPRKDGKEKLFQANEAAAQYYHNLLVNSPAGEKAKNYLLGRGLTLKTINDFQLGVSPNAWEMLMMYLLEKGFSESELLDAGLILKSEEGKIHDRFHNRLMFPIRDAIWTHECATGGLWLPDYGFPFWLIFSVNDRNPQQYYYDWNTYYSYDEVTPDHWCYVHWFNYSTYNNSPFNPTVSSVEGADWMMFDDPNPGNYVTIFSYTIPWTVVSAS